MEVQNVPEIGVDKVLKKAFHYWSKSLGFQFLFSLIYLSILLFVGYYFSTQYGILDQYIAAFAKAKDGAQVYEKEISDIMQNPNYLKFYYIMLATLVFLYPLNIGLFHIYRKIDLGEKLELQDLLAGYDGVQFFKFLSFYLFWVIIFYYAAPTLFLGIFWVLITLFTGPLMYFQNKRNFECFGINFAVLKKYFIVILVGLIVSTLFKLVGMLTIVFLPFAYPFSNAMVYALYSEIFKDSKDNAVK
jgi:hypothetical protein